MGGNKEKSEKMGQNDATSWIVFISPPNGLG